MKALNIISAALQQSLDSSDWMTSPGVIGTFILILVIMALMIFILLYRVNRYLGLFTRKKITEENAAFNDELIALDSDTIDEILEERKKALDYKLLGNELSGKKKPKDDLGLVSKISNNPNNPFFDQKRHNPLSLQTPKALKTILIWYLGAATFWLFFGTLVGQYVGMKFVWPELDSISWLSFGRLRPVHTNTVFWGWASLAIIGLSYFVIVRTSDVKIHSVKKAWLAWGLINAAVFFGNIFVMAGINNGGGEYREYIWPIMMLFSLGLIVTFINFYKTVAARKIKDIYISNWFILAGLLWTAVLSIIGYLPFYQESLGETIVQGYYMHQAVGMWFMTSVLGLIYYYLPSALNKPIYSYSLGVLAFWTQMLFYTLIGTHHFVFSPLPWWLQTVAIVFSAGMFIPVISGTTNFLMTMKGSWSNISKSYVLPFFLVGVVFYFVGSIQGSFQAFRFTNYIWHFTDFNVAHSHMTMYGIITFILWACTYSIFPKITGREPAQVLVGTHFWLAFVGFFAYMISMMAGGTLKGLSWIDGNPFLESVLLMKPYWLWRAIGGSFMFLSHLVFAFNFYLMVRKPKQESSYVTESISTL